MCSPQSSPAGRPPFPSTSESPRWCTLQTGDFRSALPTGLILMRTERGDQTLQIRCAFLRAHQDLTISLDHHEILNAKRGYGAGVRIYDAILRVDRHVVTSRYISV